MMDGFFPDRRYRLQGFGKDGTYYVFCSDSAKDIRKEAIKRLENGYAAILFDSLTSSHRVLKIENLKEMDTVNLNKAEELAKLLRQAYDGQDW